jgi:hypothetical protein
MPATVAKILGDSPGAEGVIADPRFDVRRDHSLKDSVTQTVWHAK